MLFEKVKELSAKKGKNVKEVALELGFSENYFYSWKKSSPKAEMLQKVADYFNVSTDFLLGREIENNLEDDLVFYRMNLDGLSEEEIAEVKRQIEIAEEIAIRNIRNKK